MSSRALKKLYGKSDLDVLSSQLNQEEGDDDDDGGEVNENDDMVIMGE